MTGRENQFAARRCFVSKVEGRGLALEEIVQGEDLISIERGKNSQGVPYLVSVRRSQVG